MEALPLVDVGVSLKNVNGGTMTSPRVVYFRDP